MLEVVAILSSGAVEDEATLRPLLTLASEAGGAEFGRYDLNQMEHWRAWDLERAIIDAATQRTQFFRADGVGMLFLAMGKHGETPTVMLRLDGDLDAVTLEPWFDVPRVEQVRLSTPAWRSAHGHLPQRWAWRSAPVGVLTRPLRNAHVCEVVEVPELQREALSGMLGMEGP